MCTCRAVQNCLKYHTIHLVGYRNHNVFPVKEIHHVFEGLNLTVDVDCSIMVPVPRTRLRTLTDRRVLVFRMKLFQCTVK